MGEFVGFPMPSAERRHGLTLLVGAYREPSAARRAELTDCLRANIANSLIAEVRVFLEDDADPRERPPLDHPKIRVVPHGRRLTFQDLFQFANRELSGRRVIIANNDIYFDRTLARLDEHDLTGKLLCLSRWDVQADGTTRFFEHSWSQDAWIFQAPIADFRADWHLGVPACESRLAYEASQAGLTLSNPARSVRAYHLHLTQVRHYTEQQRLPGEGCGVEATCLGGRWLWPIVACGGPLDDARQTLVTLASQRHTTVVLVDCAGPEDSVTWMREHLRQAIVVEAVGARPVSRGEAHNRGAAVTDPDAILCFMSAGAIVAPDFAESILAAAESEVFLVPDGADGAAESVLVCTRAAFDRVGGYDLHFSGSNHHDGADLHAALEHAGFARRTFPASWIVRAGPARAGFATSGSVARAPDVMGVGPGAARDIEMEIDAAYRRLKSAIRAEIGEGLSPALLRVLRRAVAHRKHVERGLAPAAPPAAAAFRETMGYLVATLAAGISSHTNDHRPFEAVPDPLAGLRFTQVVASCVSPVEIEFRSAGKVYVLVGTDWSGQVAAADFLRDRGYREPVPFVRTRAGTGFEVWSLVGEPGERIEVPTQVMLVARELERA